MLRVRWLLAVMAVTILGVATPAAAAAPERVRLGSHATLTGAGDVLLTVWVRCTGREDLLEAFVYVTDASGATSFFSSINPRCTGRPERLLVAVHPSTDQVFAEGRARATAYLLFVDDETGATRDLQDTRAILIH